MLGPERAENRVEDFTPDEEARSKAKVVMRVTLDECSKAA